MDVPFLALSQFHFFQSGFDSCTCDFSSTTFAYLYRTVHCLPISKLVKFERRMSVEAGLGVAQTGLAGGVCVDVVALIRACCGAVALG